MTTGHFITNFDFSILDFIFQNIRCDFLDPIMAGLSMFAEKGIGWIVLAVILIIPKKTRLWGIMALAAVLLGFLTGELIIKNLVCRPRPFHDYQFFHNNQALPFELNVGRTTGYSFPSGHTCCSFASAVVYFMGNKKVGIVALVFAVLIAFSRLYNYVHYPSDVFAGMVLGIVCALFTVWLFRKFNWDRKILRRGK